MRLTFQSHQDMTINPSRILCVSDDSKSCDHLPFVDIVMGKMCLCQKWRDWIMKCLTLVNYTVLINGEQSKIVKPQHGLRQGDPISPYLYILFTEGLSRLIKYNIQQLRIQGFMASKIGPLISHLLFADDSLVFCKETPEEARNLKNIINMY